MTPADWVEKNGKYISDDRVVDQKTATQYQGKGAKYIGKSAEVYSKKTAIHGSGDVYTDRVTLGKDGSVSRAVRRGDFPNFETQLTLDAGDKGVINNFNGSEFVPKQTTGAYIGLSAGFAFLGGFGISSGVVMDATGSIKPYFTFSGNVGIGQGIGIDVGSITPTGGNQFYKGDFSGSSASYNIGITTPAGGFSYSKGGSVDSQSPDKLNMNSFGKNDRGYTTDQQSFGPTGKASVGAMYSYGITW